MQGVYADRMDASTRWLLDFLGERGIHGTFFVVAKIAKSHPQLIRRIVDDGHEVASHSLEHRQVFRLKPEAFREDLRVSKEMLEQAGGTAVVGFRTRPSAFCASRPGRSTSSPSLACATIRRSSRCGMIAMASTARRGRHFWCAELSAKCSRCRP